MLNLKKLKIKLPRRQVVSYAIVLLALILAGSLSYTLAQVSAPHKIESSVKQIKITKKADTSPTPTQEIKPGVNKQIIQVTKAISHDLSPQPTVISKQATSTNTNTTTNGSSNSSPTSTPQVNASKINVTLSVDGGSSSEITIDNGANQCDVLTKALEQGKIQSLNMRYDNSLGSNGVYQINGIGKDNSIWWTYKVNGKSPSQGCSYVKANNGDSVEWNYQGSL